MDSHGKGKRDRLPFPWHHRFLTADASIGDSPLGESDRPQRAQRGAQPSRRRRPRWAEMAIIPFFVIDYKRVRGYTICAYDLKHLQADRNLAPPTETGAVGRRLSCALLALQVTSR